MYVDERLTAEQIATRLGCTGTTVLRRLRRLGIAVRGRGPLVEDRASWPVWTPELAYVVGLIATDGNLSPDGRHLAIPSRDRSLLESIRSCLGLTNRIREECPVSRPIYRLQWGDRAFYDWLVHRIDPGQEPHAPGSDGPRRALPRLLSRLHRWRRLCTEIHGSLSRA